MKATEVRIGNYVKRRNIVGEVMFVTRGNIGVEFEDGDEYYLDSEIDGIPIAEEWLLKFGFKINKFFEDSPQVYCYSDFYINFDTLQPEDSGFQIAKQEIKYVHQLQNLYFDLTGQELSINHV